MTGNLGSVGTQVARRWRSLDPLLPLHGRLLAATATATADAQAGGGGGAGAPGAPHCGTPLVVSRDGAPIAVGRCEHWVGQPGSLELSWGAARRYQLTAEVAGEVAGTGPVGGVAAGLDELLSLWRDHLADRPDAADEDTAAVVDWPSRDVDGIAALLRHGFAPLEVLAVRSASPRQGNPRSTSGSPNGPVLRLDPRLSLRRAAPADAETVARLGLEIIRFDTRFGAVNERPDTLDALRREASDLLAGAEPWTWLAERDGQPVGLLAAQRPEATGWIMHMTRPEPAAYLSLMFVEPGERGGGVAVALAEEFHAALDAAGVDLALLHHEQLNPLSAPFWHRQGYRPLWTSWQARPACALRLPGARPGRRVQVILKTSRDI